LFLFKTLCFQSSVASLFVICRGDFSSCCQFLPLLNHSLMCYGITPCCCDIAASDTLVFENTVVVQNPRLRCSLFSGESASFVSVASNSFLVIESLPAGVIYQRAIALYIPLCRVLSLICYSCRSVSFDPSFLYSLFVFLLGRSSFFYEDTELRSAASSESTCDC